MSNVLYVETATSGRWNYTPNAPDEEQPYLVRLAFLLEDAEGTLIQEGCHLIRLPEGVRMAGEAAHYLGIYDHNIQGDGASVDGVLKEFSAALAQASLVVAHSWQSRRKELECTYRRQMDHVPIWPQSACAMIKATNIVKIPDIRSGGRYKWPSFVQSCEKFGIPKLDPTMDPTADGFAKVRAVRLIWHGIRSAGESSAA